MTKERAYRHIRLPVTGPFLAVRCFASVWYCSLVHPCGRETCRFQAGCERRMGWHGRATHHPIAHYLITNGTAVAPIRPCFFVW
ncbi:MAG: hypothetical protein KJ069_14160 [Anaerolineae bacterium]|nr:hypothetical protein [Anaerolineae bacterium]